MDSKYAKGEMKRIKDFFLSLMETANPFSNPSDDFRNMMHRKLQSDAPLAGQMMMDPNAPKGMQGVDINLPLEGSVVPQALQMAILKQKSAPKKAVK